MAQPDLRRGEGAIYGAYAMNPHLFSLTARPELAEHARVLFASDATTPIDVLRTRVKALATAYVDSIVDGMILAFISPNDAGTRTESLIRNLASIIKSVGHGLVSAATSAAKKEEIERVIAYVRAQIVLADHGASIHFALAKDTREGFSQVITARHAGRIDEEREVLVSTMLAFTDEALRHYLEGPFELVELGFLTRKAFDVGHTSIRAGARSAIKHSLAPGGDSDVTHLVDFFDRTIVRP